MQKIQDKQQNSVTINNNLNLNEDEEGLFRRLPLHLSARNRQMTQAGQTLVLRQTVSV